MFSMAISPAIAARTAAEGEENARAALAAVRAWTKKAEFFVGLRENEDRYVALAVGPLLVVFQIAFSISGTAYVRYGYRRAGELATEYVVVGEWYCGPESNWRTASDLREVVRTAVDAVFASVERDGPDVRIVNGVVARNRAT